MDYEWLDWPAYEASYPQPSPRDYQALVAENPWLRLTFLPGLGGRLYRVTVKATGDDVFYHNPVIKPTHWGPEEQGWWLAAGGMEWCFPVDEHGYHWGTPWEYALSTTSQGITVTLSDTTASSRVRARITVHLPADRASFQVTPRLENPGSVPRVVKFWHNAMLAPGGSNTVGPELRFAVPIDQVTVHSRGDSYLPGDGEPMDWPEHGGTDFSRLGNWNRWLGFFARPQAAQDWVGVYDEESRRGIARVFPHQVALGAKAFAFGWEDPLDWHLWTDDGSTYVELHGGPSPTFWDGFVLSPGQALEWTETWLPLHDLPALSLSASDMALGLRAEAGDVSLGVQVSGERKDTSLRLWRGSDCGLLWREDGLDLAAGEAWTHTVRDIGLGTGEVVLAVLHEGRLLAATGDISCPPPTSEIDAIDSIQPTTDFTVTWSATDPAGLLAGYDVQVRDGDTGAAWSGWLTNTTATSASFDGVEGHTYCFRSRARDALSRLEAWPTGEWQDAFTTVLSEPGPVLVTSSKQAQPLVVHPGDSVEFQIHLNNSGDFGTSVVVSDPLPAGMLLLGVPYSNHLPDPLLVEDTILWSGALAAGQSGVVIGFRARVPDLPPGGALSNEVWIHDGRNPALRRQVTIRRWAAVHLPLILKR
jgi:uncharacterized repeat protein (TIGR01451 family)